MSWLVTGGPTRERVEPGRALTKAAEGREGGGGSGRSGRTGGCVFEDEWVSGAAYT